MPRASWDSSEHDVLIFKLEVSDLDNDPVGGLIGPNEEPILVVLERAVVPMGFKPYEKVPSNIQWFPGWEPGS